MATCRSLLALTLSVLAAIAMGACSKSEDRTAAAAPPAVASQAAKDPDAGWKEYVVADGAFVVNYPAAGADAAVVRCSAEGKSTTCGFLTARSVLYVMATRVDTKGVIDRFVAGEKRTKKLLESRELNVDGWSGRDFAFTSETDGEERTRAFARDDLFVTATGLNKNANFAESKDEIERFVASLAPRTAPAAAR